MMLSAIIGTIVIVLITIAVGLVLDRKTSLVPKPEELATPPKRATTHGAGEAPATALRAGEVALANLRKGQRCPACRSEMTYAESADDHVRYNERDMLVLHFTCPRCATKKVIYVEPATSTSRPQ
jgi:hypothetical protein